MNHKTKFVLCGRRVTLNGQRAALSGAKNDFATVTDLKTGLSAEWAWSTADKIVLQGGGKFFS